MLVWRYASCSSEAFAGIDIRWTKKLAVWDVSMFFRLAHPVGLGIAFLWQFRTKRVRITLWVLNFYHPLLWTKELLELHPWGCKLNKTWISGAKKQASDRNLRSSSIMAETAIFQAFLLSQRVKKLHREVCRGKMKAKARWETGLLCRIAWRGFWAQQVSMRKYFSFVLSSEVKEQWPCKRAPFKTRSSCFGIKMVFGETKALTVAGSVFILGVPINLMGNVGKSSLSVTGWDCGFCVKPLSCNISSIISVVFPGHCMRGLYVEAIQQLGVKNGKVQVIYPVLGDLYPLQLSCSSIKSRGAGFFGFGFLCFSPKNVIFCSLEDWSPLCLAGEMPRVWEEPLWGEQVQLFGTWSHRSWGARGGRAETGTAIFLIFPNNRQKNRY